MIQAPKYSVINAIFLDFKESVLPSNEYPLYFSYDRKSLFSPLDAIKVLSRLEIFFFIFNNFRFSIPTYSNYD